MSLIPDTLARIQAYKLKHIEACKKALPYEAVCERIKGSAGVRGFQTALKIKAQSGTIALIAEIKKASPSKGLIRDDFDPPELAKAYEKGGATCLSVLTDTPSFQGADKFLNDARNACSLPVLRKEFLYDIYQVAEARMLGADAILVILSAVDDACARALILEAHKWDMDVLVEVHDADEMKRAIDLGAPMIGINNRNLRTFETTLETFETLAPMGQDVSILVGESGIFNRSDASRMKNAGASALLVGESLMRQSDVTLATQALLA